MVLFRYAKDRNTAGAAIDCFQERPNNHQLPAGDFSESPAGAFGHSLALLGLFAFDRDFVRHGCSWSNVTAGFAIVSLGDGLAPLAAMLPFTFLLSAGAAFLIPGLCR